MAIRADAIDCGVDIGIDLPHLWVPEAYCLDMDRTTLRSDRCLEHLTSLVLDPSYGLDGATILEQQLSTEADGGTYNPTAYLEEHLDPQAFDRLGQVFMGISDPTLAYPDAKPLYSALSASPGVPHHMLTFGTTAAGHPSLWQGMKAPHSQFDGYVEITSQPDKGPHIETMRGPSGTFDYFGLDELGQPIAVYHAASVVLVDDKALAHTHLPQDCRGYLLMRPEEPRLPSQGTEVPANVADRVQIVRKLSSIVTDHEVRPNNCLGGINAPAEQVQPAAYRPAYPSGATHFGMVINRTTTFTDIRKQVEAYTAKELVWTA